MVQTVASDNVSWRTTPVYRLCDLGQVILSLPTSVSSSVKMRTIVVFILEVVRTLTEIRPVALAHRKDLVCVSYYYCVAVNNSDIDYVSVFQV